MLSASCEVNFYVRNWGIFGKTHFDQYEPKSTQKISKHWKRDRTFANIGDRNVIQIDVLLLLKGTLTRDNFFRHYFLFNTCCPINFYSFTCHQKYKNDDFWDKNQRFLSIFSHLVDSC